MKVLFALSFILMILQSRALAKDRADFPSATKVIETALEAKAFPGCTVVVGTETNIVWSDAFGRFDYGTGTAVRTDTIYDLASVTKVAATTSTYMRLVALGKVRVTEPVSKYLPEFVKGASTDEEKKQREEITIEHLLTHTSGLASWKPFYREVKTYRLMIERIVATPLESAPGARFRYSDPGMMLLGEIAERAGGKPLPTLAHELVFAPLKMTSTMYNPPRQLLDRIPPTERSPDNTNTFVHGVVHDENARAAEGRTGHAGLFSTAEDLAKLAQELLRGLDGRSTLFPREVVAEFVRDRRMVSNSERGLGWGLGETKWPDGSSSHYIAHNGFTGTYLRIDHDRKLFLILLSNRVHPTRDNDQSGRVRGRWLEAVFQDLERNGKPLPSVGR